MLTVMRVGLYFWLPLLLLGQIPASAADALDRETDTRIDAEASNLPLRDGMVLVPAGWFWRGSCNEATSPSCKPGELGYSTTASPDYMSYDEAPMRQIYLDAYYLDTFEVTVSAFAACVTAGACTKANYDEKGRNASCNLGDPNRLNHPMNCVSWYGANQYCKFAGKRLPTEAEWEKGARGTDGRKYPWGNTAPDCTYTNFCQCVGTTTPAGTYPKGVSPYGAYDMSGNMLEWTYDTYSSDYYVKSPDTNPQGPTNDGAYRVNRGGSYGSNSECISQQRAPDRASSARGAKVGTIGFRCVAAP